MAEEEQGGTMKLHDLWQRQMVNRHEEQPKINNRQFKGQGFQSLKIYTTNPFHNRVCLNISRFNHSCYSNADYLLNNDTNTRDVRAVKKINKGEEIARETETSQTSDIGEKTLSVLAHLFSLP